jgi:hypothetical protein
MATPKAKRIFHNIEENTMTYRFTELIDIPEELDLDYVTRLTHEVADQAEYPPPTIVRGWIEALTKAEREIKMEFSGGKFDPDKMKIKVEAELRNVVATAELHLVDVTNYRDSKVAKIEASEREQRGNEPELMVDDISSEVTLSSDVVPSSEVTLEPFKVVDETAPVVAAKPVRKRSNSKNKK